MTPDDRAQLRALLAAATPGEWAPGTPDDDVAETRAEWVRTCLLGPDEPAAGALWSVWVPDDQEVLGSRIVAITGDGAHGRADAELIATAANSLRALLDALDAAEAGIEQVRALHRPDQTPDDAIAAWLTTPEQAARVSPTPDLAELRRRHAALTPFALRFRSGGPGGDPYIALAGEDGSPLSESGFDAVLMFAEIAAADLPSLLNAADERDALTVVQPCVMKLGEVYDFAWCETHDRTFALGGTCDHAGLSHVDYLDDDGRTQRGRAVRAEMERDALAAERDALRDAPHPDRPDCAIVGGRGIRVTATDLETGESQSAVIDDNYALICAGDCYQSGIQYHADGTVTLTVKGRRNLAVLAEEPQP